MVEPEMFALTIASQGLLGSGIAGFAVRAVPIVELMVGGAAVVVVFSGSRVAGVVAGVLLSLLFWCLRVMRCCCIFAAAGACWLWFGFGVRPWRTGRVLRAGMR